MCQGTNVGCERGVSDSAGEYLTHGDGPDIECLVQLSKEGVLTCQPDKAVFFTWAGEYLTPPIKESFRESFLPEIEYI